MNYSILCLSATLHFTSPLLSISHNKANLDFFLNRVYFQQSFSHFLFSQSYITDFHIQNSKFKNFLSSTIIVNTLDISDKYFFKENLVYRKDINVKLQGTIFDSCSSMSLGGAIQILANSNRNSSLNITDCLFDKCCAMIHGGAIFALVSHYFIESSCFKYCWARDKQVASLRSESNLLHSINFTTIYMNGKQPYMKSDEDLIPKNSILTTFSSFAPLIVVANINNTKNTVTDNCAGHYIISSYMAYLKHSTFSDNSGEKILHISLKNNSSIDHINLINNSAYLKYKGLIFCSAKTTFEDFIFIKNMHPLVCTSRYGNVNLINCLFDFPENQITKIDNDNKETDNKNLDIGFEGNVSYQKCVFDNKLSITHETFTIPPILCKNKYDYDQDEEKSKYINWFLCILYFIFALIIIYVILFIYFRKPSYRLRSRLRIKREEEREERVPFISKKREKFYT